MRYTLATVALYLVLASAAGATEYECVWDYESTHAVDDEGSRFTATLRTTGGDCALGDRAPRWVTAPEVAMVLFHSIVAVFERGESTYWLPREIDPYDLRIVLISLLEAGYTLSYRADTRELVNSAAPAKATEGPGR